MMLSEEGTGDLAQDCTVVERVENLLRKAALHSYKDLLHLLSTPEDENSQSVFSI